MRKLLAQGKGNSKEMDWSRESYRTIFEMVKDAIFITTVDGRIIDVNPSCLELFGYRDKEEALTLDLARDIYVNSEDRTRLLELVEREGFVKGYEIEAKRRDGTKILISLSDQVIRDEKGKTICYVGMIRDITQRREYERRLEEYAEKLEREVQERTRALRESEEKYRSLFEGSKDALYITTEEGKFTDLNQATAELFGYADKEELMKIESTAQLYVNPEDRKKMQEIMSEQGYVKDMEQELRRKDGTKIHALITGTIRKDERGAVIGYEGMIKDVTEHKRTEERLRESEERLRTLVTSAPLGLSIIGGDGVYEYVTPKFVEMFGYTLDDVPAGRTWFEKAYPDQEYRRKVITSWKEDLRGDKTGETRPRVFAVTCKDGSKKEVFFRSVTLTDGRQLVTYEDITDRKRAEEQLRESEERYRSLVEDINDGYFIVQDGSFVYVNQAFATLSGYTKEAILGRGFSDLLPQEYWEGLSGSDGSEAGDREHGGQYEFEISSEGGENLVLEIRSRIMEFNGRPAIAGICKDITERKKAEMALKEKIEELERWYHLTVDREIKMTELKNRIQELESELKEMRENRDL
jgi:PAS domain S-box-containing protein